MKIEQYHCFQCGEELTPDNDGMLINDGDFAQCNDCHYAEYGYYIWPVLLHFNSPANKYIIGCDVAEDIDNSVVTTFKIHKNGLIEQLKKKMNILELFAGSRSFCQAAEQLGHNTFSVDWEGYEKIDLQMDISKMKIEDVPYIPDVIWASPDCTTYTIAAISTHRNGIEPKSEYAKQCDITNQHFIGLIKYWLSKNPSMVFFIENPRGMLRKMPWMQEFKRHTVWYCQYGDDRAKPTDIWTNSDKWIPRPVCHNGNKNCHHQPAPRGSKTGTQGRKGSYDRSKIPQQLCLEILNSI